jgi:hypothetical protein
MSRNTLNEILISSQLLQNAALTMLDYAKVEASLDGKRFLNLQINRLNANRNDAYSYIDTEEGRQIFATETKAETALELGHLVMLFFELDSNQRTLLETIAEGLRKGEQIEFVGGDNY